jgi:hypothetical protein
MDPRCQGQQVRTRRGPRRTRWKCDDESETAAQRGMRCGMLMDGWARAIARSMAVELTISSRVYSHCCGGRRNACLEAIMLGLSLVRLLGVRPCQHGWCAGGLGQAAPHALADRDIVVESLVAEGGRRGSPTRCRGVSWSVAGTAALSSRSRCLRLSAYECLRVPVFIWPRWHSIASNVQGARLLATRAR